jgi:hypothetical protein
MKSCQAVTHRAWRCYAAFHSCPNSSEECFNRGLQFFSREREKAETLQNYSAGDLCPVEGEGEDGQLEQEGRKPWHVWLSIRRFPVRFALSELGHRLYRSR